MTSTTIDVCMVASDHLAPINPLNGSAVVKVVSGDTVYYNDHPYVTSSTNQGSVALNASHTFTRPAWLLSAGLSSVQITTTGVVDDTDLDATAQAAATAAAEAASVLRDGTGLPPLMLPIAVSGTLSVAAGVLRYRVPAAITLLSVAITANTAPTGAAILVDVNKNGTTVFTTQGNRPTIAISGFASTDAVPDVTAVAAGDYLSVDVDQVGSTIAGANLVATVRYR